MLFYSRNNFANNLQVYKIGYIGNLCNVELSQKIQDSTILSLG